jgi:uncharacterized membrane protein YuzA (DUF378 family)
VKILKIISIILVIVGGLNWGLVGLFNFDLVAAIFGAMSSLSKIVYVLVGLAAVYIAVISNSLLKDNSKEK